VGGDEFVILANYLSAEAEVELLLDKINASFKKPVTIANRGLLLDVSISTGVSLAPDHSCDPKELLHFADVAMFEAKKDTKREYVIYTAES
jgi:diguanylate cyclase (GGDEF)-like protein